jgi:alginate O-acetyltransferase complex protein AlgI
MLVAGIWHGAAWGFIVWGLLHGVALVIHRLTEALSTRVSALKIWWESIPGVVMAWALTQGMVFISWICFRLPNLKDSSWALLHLWGHTADPQFAQKVYVEGFGLQRFQMGLLLEALVAAMAVSFVLHRGLKLELNSPLKILLVPVCFFAVWLLAPEGTPPFIYFDF